MSAAAALLKFLAFVGEHAPEIEKTVRGALCAFWGQCHVDLGPLPPDLSGFEAADARFDAAIAAKRKQKT